MSPDADWNSGLSDEQAAAMLGRGDLFLTACPGSGKTRSIAARVAMLAKRGEALALLSYTNTGADEIASAVMKQHRVRVEGSNFVGTLHSFLLRYLISPFAHLLTHSNVPVRMDPVAVSELAPAGMNVHDYRYGVDGELEPKKAWLPASRSHLDSVHAIKMEAAEKGVIGYDDALYWAREILRRYPNISHALASRFDEVIVDEAQDSNEDQLEVLRALKVAGLKSLVLVGDYDQTIYSFGGSRPDLCESLAEDLGLEPRALRENFRSSQILCNTSAKFRSNKTPDRAVGEFADFMIEPRILRYDPSRPADLRGRFTNLLEQIDLRPRSSVILARSRALRAELAGHQDVRLWSEIETLIRAKRSEHAPSLRVWRELELMLLQRVFGPANPEAAGVDRVVLRRYAMDLVQDLPDLNGSVGEWVAGAMALVDDTAGQRLTSAVSRIVQDGRDIPSEWESVDIRNVLRDPDGCDIDTIHSSKGTSVDAVMLVAGLPSKPTHTSDAEAWSQPLAGRSRTVHHGKGGEELRIFYVGLTRAQRALVLAVPESTSQRLVDRFVSAGFQEA